MDVLHLSPPQVVSNTKLRMEIHVTFHPQKVILLHVHQKRKHSPPVAAVYYMTG